MPNKGGPSQPRLVMLNYILAGTAYTIAIDATTNEQHGAHGTLTTHKVEKGSNITDNFTPMPDKLTLECAVSDTPIYPVVLSPSNAGVVANPNEQHSVTLPNGKVLNFTTLGFGGQPLGRVIAVFNALIDATKGAAIFQVITTIKTYENLVITDFDCPRNAQNSNAIMFTLQFGEAVVATTQTTNAVAPKKQPQHRGSKPVKETPPPTKAEVKKQRLGLLRSLVKGTALD